MATLIWFFFTIIGGLLGIIFNMVQRCVFGSGGDSPWQSFVTDCKSGVLYTFALVLVCSILSPVFISFIKNKSIDFRRIKIAFISLCVFSMLFSSVFYSNHVSSVEMREKSIKGQVVSKNGEGYPKQKIENTYYWQYLFCFISILIAFYSLGLSYMDEEPGTYNDINDNEDYGDKENDRKRKMKERTEETNATPDNIEL